MAPGDHQIGSRNPKGSMGPRRSQEAPEGSRRLHGGRRPQDAPEGAHGAPGGYRRLQDATGSSRKLQEVSGGLTRLQQAWSAPHTQPREGNAHTRANTTTRVWVWNTPHAYRCVYKRLGDEPYAQRHSHPALSSPVTPHPHCFHTLHYTLTQGPCNTRPMARSPLCNAHERSRTDAP